MLQQLSIKNFAIIEDLEVNFSSGFLALTGETGAGKSIIIDAISMLLGTRSTFDKIRHGQTKAFIEGIFFIESQEVIEKLSSILDDEIDDNSIIISRSLDIQGKSIAKINGLSVSLSLLKQVTSTLLDIHSQQKNANYLQEDQQIKLYDQFLMKTNDEFKKAFNEYKDAYSSYLVANKELNTFLSNFNADEDLDYLDYQVKEIEKAKIQPHEMEDLEEEKNRLSAFKRFSERVISFLNEYESIKSPLYNAKKQLSYLEDEDFVELSEKFSDLYYQIDDIASQIEDKFSEYQSSLERLETINERLYLLHSLRRKYGYSTDDILNKYEELIKTIDQHKNFDVEKEKLSKIVNEHKTNASLKAINVSKLRKKYAYELEKLVENELKDLHLNHAHFKVDIIDDDALSNFGCDKVVFLLQANEGEGYLSLSKTASLGETSRLNLALKTVFNRLGNTATIIFDEIDIGISGRVASSVAKKMKEISKYNQVIAISHLPQVCALADYHYHIQKEIIEGRTYSSIKLLNRQERILEIAKMMSNENVNESSINAAEALFNEENS